MNRSKTPGRPVDTYFDRVKRHPLPSIRTEADLDAAQAVIDELLRLELDEAGWLTWTPCPSW